MVDRISVDRALKHSIARIDPACTQFAALTGGRKLFFPEGGLEVHGLYIRIGDKSVDQLSAKEVVTLMMLSSRNS